ncbi:MAG: DUF4127 family protein, partial [Bacilli bacterium]|nr:DUF4127 family protein [Bacilli bacterium]
NKKRSAKINELKLWIKENIIDCDYLIISLDTLIYGGLIPSRLHHSSLEELIFNLDYIKEIKELNPKLKIYVFLTIMRTPNSNFNGEEPTYYAKYGKMIFRIGQLLNKQKINIITEAENKELITLKKKVPSKVINDYIDRRIINMKVLRHAYDMYVEGVFDYFYIPQDDSSPFGFTRIDQMEIKEYMKDKDVLLFPGADEVGMVMITRAINDYYQVSPKVYVHYASSMGAYVVPSFEDRMIDLTINSQITSIGGIRVESVTGADIVLMVNIGSAMIYFPTAEERIIPYDINRNLSEFISFLKYAKSLGKIVGVADVADPVYSDLELVNLLNIHHLLLEIDGYAGWNTASNTVGTVLAETSILNISKNKKANKKFLIHRYYDDVGYCSHARGWTDVNAALARGYSEGKLDGKNGTCVAMARGELMDYMEKMYPDVSKYVKDIKVSSPWNRTFEMQFNIKYKNIK